MEREELHRRVKLLQKMKSDGKLHIAAHLIDDFSRSMAEIKFSTDGIVIPSTVDGRVRAMCVFIAHLNDRQEWKDAISLKNIQESFFQRVEYAFGQLFEMMIKANVGPYRFADWFCSDKQRVLDCLGVITEFLEEIKSFWDNISDPTWIHLEDTLNSKAVFTGELFPDGRSNVASSTGLYFDTTVLPDPFIKVLPMLQFMSDDEKCREVVRLALQVLTYKSLALEDLEKPIVAILPDRFQSDEDYKKFIHDCAVADSIAHTQVLFNQSIKDRDELFEYYSHFADANEIANRLIEPGKLIFATEWDGGLPDQIDRFLKEQGTKLGLESHGQAVFMHLISRFSQANDAFQRSLELKGTPIIRAETSWIWYNHMLEYNAGNSSMESLNDLHIARALNSTVKNEISWMGNIPPDSLIEIRKSGALDEIRHLLSGGIQDLINSNPKNFYRTGDQVFDNLDSAFRQHDKKIKELSSKKWKFAGKDVGSFVVVGGIEITAAMTGLPLYGTVGAMASMSGVIPTVKDLREKYMTLTAEESEVKNTGVGILLRSKNS